jgi:hypothetical protein
MFRRLFAPSRTVGRCAASTTAPKKPASVNSLTLVGVVHDIQTGYVFEDPVTQFTLTTTSIDTTSPLQECVVEKDHHTIRCYGEEFSAEIKSRLQEGNVVCVSGRLRLNPQLEASCNKHFYFPYVHVIPPHGQVAVVHGDRRKPPAFADGPLPTTGASGGGDSSAKSAAPSTDADGNNAKSTGATAEVGAK